MTKEDTQGDDGAPGWDAIDASLTTLYGSKPPRHYGTVVPYALGGPDPLDGISVFTRDGETPHFHFVSFGLTELYEKTSELSEVSGYGFELTFRLARSPGEDEPPMWPLNFLQNIARYVFSTGNVFGPGHHVDLNGPIALERETELRAIAFCRDPELPPGSTPNGRMEFMQVVGVTLDELAAARRWKTDGVLGLLAGKAPLLVTDLARASILREPAIAAELEAGVQRDGSSCGSLFLTELDWTAGPSPTITIGASVVRELVDVLPGRLRFGRKLALARGDKQLVLAPGDETRISHDVDELVVALPAQAVSELVRVLLPKRGTYTLESAPELRFIVKPSPIRDRDGNVIEVVGE